MYAPFTDAPIPVVPSVADRRKRNRQEMVDGILAAARAQMREDGVAALNLNEVARRVGVTTPALYKYFPSKMAIYDALFRFGTRLYLEEFKALNLGEAESGGAAIRRALEHQLSFADRHPELYQLVLQRPVPGFVPSDEGLLEAAQAQEVAVMFVSRWIERGLIAPPLPPERVFALLASVPDNDNLAFRMQALARTFNWGFAFTARSRPSRPTGRRSRVPVSPKPDLTGCSDSR